MGIDITGIGSVADLAKTAINAIWPDKTEQEKQQLAAAVMVVQGQLDINREEAKNPSVFVSGWRPFIGWVCGSACAWNWIGLPMVKAGVVMAGYHALPISPADLSEMMPILMGMLGLGAYRTFEKVKGVAAK
jgi:hypothetical protein